MKTYIICLINTTGNCFNNSTVDFEIFSSIDQASHFYNREAAYNYLDDSVIRLKEEEDMLAIYSVLAQGPLDANERAWQLKDRYE